MQTFKHNQLYAVEGFALSRLRAIALRLYTEQRLTGDDMRDFAQSIDAALNQAIELTPDNSDPSR